MSLPIGTRLGPYELVAPVGAGGMGEVFRARDTRLNRDVAVKVLPAGVYGDPSRRSRFEQEARAAAALHHPGIVAVFDVGEQDGVAYMVTELVDGETLRGLLAGGALPLRKAADLGVQVAEALAAAHAAGISHRDLKPENIMVTREGRAKILDFGLAKFAPQTSTEATLTNVGTEPGAVMGTVGYMSPEQARGLAADHRADLFSFGVVLYEMLGGKRAFQRDTAIETLNAIIKEDPAPLPPGVPAAYGTVVSHCLEKEPVARFQSAKDLAFALQFAGGTSVVSGSTMPVAAPRRWMRWEWLAAPVLVAIGFAGRGWLMPGTEGTAHYTVRPLTAFEGVESHPALSPNGQQLAFTKDNSIFVKLVDGSGETLKLAEGASSPVWAPDGRQIYFQRGVPPSPRTIWVMSALGGGERRIAEIPEGQSVIRGMSLSPDGRTLLLSQRRKDNGLLQVPVDGGAMHALTSPAPGLRDSGAKYSPDGRRVAFTRTAANGTRQLLVVNLTAEGSPTGEAKVLDSGTWDIRGIAWLPDGRWLVAATLDGARERLVKFPADGGKPVVLPLEWTRDDQRDRGIHEISLAGQRLAVTMPGGQQTLEKWSAAKPGGPFTREPFETSSRTDVHADQSADGKWVSFVSTRSGAMEIWRARADGSAALQLTSFGGIVVEHPRTSPDGRWIAFFAVQQGVRELWAVGSEGGLPKLVRSKVGCQCRSESIAWAPDSRSLFIEDQLGAKWAVVRIPREGGEPKQVGPDGSTAPVVSADGKWLYFRGTNAWQRMPIGGGEVSTVGEYPPTALFSGSRFYFLRTKAEGEKRELVEADPDSRTERVIHQAEATGELAYVSADGRTLFFSVPRNPGSDILLVDGIR